jgi:hypothetical protein
MKNIEKILSITAAIITVVNFIIIFPDGLKDNWLPATFISSMEVPTKLVLVTILELSLAYAFGKAFAHSFHLDDLHRFLVYMIVAFCSAWLSVFNIEMLLMGRQAIGFFEYLGFFGMIVVAWVVASIMIEGHIKNRMPESTPIEKGTSLPETNEAITFQAVAYVFIFISMLTR